MRSKTSDSRVSAPIVYDVFSKYDNVCTANQFANRVYGTFTEIEL